MTRDNKLSLRNKAETQSGIASLLSLSSEGARSRSGVRPRQPTGPHHAARGESGLATHGKTHRALARCFLRRVGFSARVLTLWERSYDDFFVMNILSPMVGSSNAFSRGVFEKS